MKQRTGGSSMIPVSLALSEWSNQRSASSWYWYTGRSRYTGGPSTIFFGPCPSFHAVKGAGQMQAIDAPAGAEVAGDLRLGIARAALAPERAVERMQEHVDDHGIGAGVRALQRRAQRLDRHHLLVLHRLRDRLLVLIFAVSLLVEA